MKIEVFLSNQKDNFRSIVGPIVRFFVQLNLDPNVLTTLSFLLAIVAAYFYIKGVLWIAAIWLLIAGFFDVIDGDVARASNRTTKFGALYDSVLDRFSEIIVILGIGIFFYSRETGHSLKDIFIGISILLAMSGSLMVSYVRARAEALGFECKNGLLQRPERVLLISIGSLISNVALIIAIGFIALFANFTAIQRIIHIWKNEKHKNEQTVNPT